MVLIGARTRSGAEPPAYRVFSFVSKSVPKFTCWYSIDTPECSFSYSAISSSYTFCVISSVPARRNVIVTASGSCAEEPDCGSAAPLSHPATIPTAISAANSNAACFFLLILHTSCCSSFILMFRMVLLYTTNFKPDISWFSVFCSNISIFRRQKISVQTGLFISSDLLLISSVVHKTAPFSVQNML